MLSFTFDSGELVKTLKRYVEATQRDAADALDHQAGLMCNGMMAGTKGLFQEARSEEKNVQAAIVAVARRGPLKRPKGRSWRAEYEKRLKYAALVQATGWLTQRYGNRLANGTWSKMRAIKNPPGKVTVGLNGSEPFVEIINTQPRALEFALKTGYVQRAIQNRIADMERYIERKMAQRAHAL